MKRIKLLLKEYIFWWNLLPAVMITILFFMFEKDFLSYVVGCVGILNWVAVIFTCGKIYKDN
jgi:hypothetical protein